MGKNFTGASSPFSGNNSKTPKQGIFAGRVSKLFLNPDDHPEDFIKFGEWASMGGILFSKLTSPTQNADRADFALPIFPNIQQPPTLNEIVYIIQLPVPMSQLKPQKMRYYYFQPLNLWNSTHHNAIPDPAWSGGGTDNARDYQQTEAGATRQADAGSDTNINLGETFNEKIDTRPLQLYEGDIIYEGRWGNSCRFGSTILEGTPENPWSSEGEDGDPITIIRNGQHDESTDPWVPQVEDINEDKANIYLTSTQKIPIEVSNKKYSSYDTEPTTPDQYVEPQVLLKSNRLVFDAKTDSILLSAENSIFLGTNDSVNISAASKVVIECDDIKFGDKDATEPFILGNKFLADMQKLCTQLVALGTALQTPIGAGPPFVPNAAIPVPAVNVTQAAQTMLNKIEKYKSKVTKSR